MHLHFKINESKCQIVFWSRRTPLSRDALHLLKNLYNIDKSETFLKYSIFVSFAYFTTLLMLAAAKEVCFQKNMLSKHGTHKDN